MKVAKFNKKKTCLYCPDCKSYEVFCDATGTYSLPVGFGFLPGKAKFSVAKIVLKGYFGQCEICKEKVFNWISKRKSIAYPQSINKKIAKCTTII